MKKGFLFILFIVSPILLFTSCWTLFNSNENNASGGALLIDSGNAKRPSRIIEADNSTYINYAPEATIKYSSISTSSYKGYQPNVYALIDGTKKSSYNHWSATDPPATIGFFFDELKTIDVINIYFGDPKRQHRLRYYVEINTGFGNDNWEVLRPVVWVDENISGVVIRESDDGNGTIYKQSISVNESISAVKICINDSSYPSSHMWRTVITEVEILSKDGKHSAGKEVNSIEYKVGDTGPAGGIIFYDKGNDSGGWQYLEAAPDDYTKIVVNGEDQRRIVGFEWGEYEKDIAGDDATTAPELKKIGTGKENTKAIVEQLGESTDYAAGICFQYELNGYDDWYLPSRDELDLMYKNLHLKGLGNFSDTGSEYMEKAYWSSTETDAGSAWSQQFFDGKQNSYYGKPFTFRVRPIRAFSPVRGNNSTTEEKIVNADTSSGIIEPYGKLYFHTENDITYIFLKLPPGTTRWLNKYGEKWKEGDGYRVSGRKVIATGHPIPYDLKNTGIFDLITDTPETDIYYSWYKDIEGTHSVNDGIIKEFQIVLDQDEGEVEYYVYPSDIEEAIKMGYRIRDIAWEMDYRVKGWDEYRIFAFKPGEYDYD